MVKKKRRRVKENDEYSDVHGKLMRKMAGEEGSDMENWEEVQKGMGIEI